jgi:hypothetical protein
MLTELVDTISKSYNKELYEAAIKAYSIYKLNLLDIECQYVYIPFVNIIYVALDSENNANDFYLRIMEACIDSFSSQKLMLNVLKHANQLIGTRLVA